MGFLKEKSRLMKNSPMETLRDNLLCLTGASVVSLGRTRGGPVSTDHTLPPSSPGSAPQVPD